jgi:hypothetical protein
VKSTQRRIVCGTVAVLSLVMVVGRGRARDAGEPDYVNLDLLRRARIIAVAGSAAETSAPPSPPATGLAAEAAATAEALARRLAETRRVHVVGSRRVAEAMTKLQLKTPRDLFIREPQIGLKIDVGKAATLARRAGADAALVPIWDTPPRDAQATGTPPLRLHVVLIVRDRKQIVWEDGALVSADAASAPGGTAVAAAADQAAKTLAQRFALLWQQAGERG